MSLALAPNLTSANLGDSRAAFGLLKRKRDLLIR